MVLKQWEKLHDALTTKVFAHEIPTYRLFNGGFQNDYKKWLKNIRSSILPNYSEIQVEPFDDSQIELIYSGIATTSPFTPEGLEVYKHFLSLFLRQRDALKKLSTQDSRGKIKIIIDETNKCVFIEDPKKGILRHQFNRIGVNRRFDDLYKIATSKKAVSGKVLMGHGERSMQAVSNQLHETNDSLKKSLKLSKSIIINEGSTGYRVDQERYTIEFQ